MTINYFIIIFLVLFLIPTTITIVDILHAIWSRSHTRDIPCSRNNETEAKQRDREKGGGWNLQLASQSKSYLYKKFQFESRLYGFAGKAKY